MTENILSVSDVNRYLKDIINNDNLLSDLLIRGEISNYKHHSSGHMYFTIKDSNGILKCVMFKTNNMDLDFVPDNGMKVIISGYISIFERDGQYQLYAMSMYKDGIGNLHMAFLKLKQKLEEEGLFDIHFKKPLPFMPKRIGVVTSSTGSVLRDIVNVLSRRFGNYNLLIYPVAVQGESAAGEIKKAIEYINANSLVDVIILARGGGSLEELWAFNEEIVARSIFSSEIPVISAVGHETDFTIADFVADMRAPTPSAAAEIVMPEKVLLKSEINTYKNRLINALIKNVSIKRLKYNSIVSSHCFKHPYEKIYQERMKVDVLNKQMIKELLKYNEKVKMKFQLLVEKLNAISPLSTMIRGYSVVTLRQDNKLINSIKNLNIKDEIIINLTDGRLYCTVNNMEGLINDQEKYTKK